MPKRKTKQDPMVKVKTPSKSKRVLGRETKDLVSVRSAIDPDVRFFVASEQADDQTIADELVGKMIDKCVYEFPAKGQGEPIRGMTITGVREAMRLINKNPKSGMKLAYDHSRMFVEEVEFNGQKGVLAKCFAVDHISGAGNWGIKFESYTKSGKNGPYTDTFVVEKATSKAQRNAIAGLIPVQMKVQMIDTFVKKGSVAKLPPPSSVPPPPKANIASTAPSKPEDLVRIIRNSVAKLKDPEELHKLADKIEHTPKLTAAQKQMLMGEARQKANTILDAQLK